MCAIERKLEPVRTPVLCENLLLKYRAHYVDAVQVSRIVWTIPFIGKENIKVTDKEIQRD